MIPPGMVHWLSSRWMSTQVGLFSLLREPRQKAQQKPLMVPEVGGEGEGERPGVEKHWGLRVGTVSSRLPLLPIGRLSRGLKMTSAQASDTDLGMKAAEVGMQMCETGG